MIRIHEPICGSEVTEMIGSVSGLVGGHIKEDGETIKHARKSKEGRRLGRKKATWF